MLIRRKFVWLMILMVWVGMVTSIIVYRGDTYLATEQITSDNVDFVENSNNEVQVATEDEVNHMQAGDKQKNGRDFFIEYRLERDKARSEQIDIFREMINNPNTGDAAKKRAQEKMLAMTERMEKEMEIEGLIRARGYNDSLAYIHDGSVDVIIQTEGLAENDVAKIGDIIVKTTGFNFEDVTIIEKQVENN